MHSREVALLWASCITVTVWMQKDINLVALGHCMYANGLESLWGLAACQRGMKLWISNQCSVLWQFGELRAWHLVRFCLVCASIVTFN